MAFSVPNVTDLPTSAAPDANGGQVLSQFKQAQFIHMWITGPGSNGDGASELLPGLTMLQMTESYTGAEFVQVASTFRSERKLGQRLYKGSYTRFQPRMRPLKVIIAECYGLNTTGPFDIRLDSYPVTVTVQYSLFGPLFDYTKTSLDTETATFSEVYFDNLKHGFIDDPNNFTSEDADMEGQNEQWNGLAGGKSILLVSKPYSAAYPLQSNG